MRKSLFQVELVTLIKSLTRAYRTVVVLARGITIAKTVLGADMGSSFASHTTGTRTSRETVGLQYVCKNDKNDNYKAISEAKQRGW